MQKRTSISINGSLKSTQQNKFSSLTLIASSFKASRESSIQVSISIVQLRARQASKNIIYKTNVMINCEISNINYISIIFVKAVKTISLKQYS